MRLAFYIDFLLLWTTEIWNFFQSEIYRGLSLAVTEYIWEKDTLAGG